MALRDNSFIADCAAFLAFSASLAVTLLFLMGGENPPALLTAVSGVIVVVVTVEILVVALIAKLFGAATRRAAFAVASGLNCFSLYLVHLNQSLTFELVYAAGAALVFGLMLAASAGKTVPRILGVVVFSLLPALSLSSTVTADKKNHENGAKIAAYQDIKLRETPNIYLISFDALMPGAAARKVLGVDNLVYEDLLRDLGAVLPKNSFVTYAPSLPSLDAVMKLDDNASFKSEGYFAGRLPSPLSGVLRANGYDIETGSSIPYYFGASGDYVDRHSYIAKNFILDNSLCKFATRRARTFGVFGFCELDRFFDTANILDEKTLFENPDAPYFDSHWHDLVLDRIADVVPRPKVSFYYYFYPIGHAPNDFVSFDEQQMAAYRKRYLIQSGKAREVIAELVEAVKKHDPGAILILFGDHGPKTSRTADWQAHTEYWVHDNHAVLIALLPSQQACAQPELGAYNQDFHTVGRVVASVLRCLADDPVKVDAAVQFLDKFPFSDFLYE